MKKVMIAVAAMIGIIIIRIILSFTVNEQVAEVFTKVSIGFLFFYFILLFVKNRRDSRKS